MIVDTKEQLMQSSKRLMLAVISILCIYVLFSPVPAQPSGATGPTAGVVQVINGYIETGNGDIYELNNLWWLSIICP